MAGHKLVEHLTTIEDGLRNEHGATIIGMPITVIIENGNVEPDDEWALFRLTDAGMWAYFVVGCEMAEAILSILIDDKPAVEEVGRYRTEEEAVEAKCKLSPEEQHRTLLRSVRPMCR